MQTSCHRKKQSYQLTARSASTVNHEIRGTNPRTHSPNKAESKIENNLIHSYQESTPIS
ncbi:tail length tape-measure protein [Salmonella phage 21]|nr:tail length tape-measure protein [Salmonella phage 21]